MGSPSLPHPGDPQGLPQPLPWTPRPQDCPSLLRGRLLTPAQGIARPHAAGGASLRGRSSTPPAYCALGPCRAQGCSGHLQAVGPAVS